jgi:S1-C subfamily serine protease
MAADVVAAVTEADVALIKLRRQPQRKITPVRLADSDGVRVGDQVMVIGAPFGIGHSLSVGYVSGRHAKKNLTGAFTLMEFLQTDAAINQGNSGGPLFNMKGEVIGIVSAILTQTGGFQGLGFAATSNIARKLLLEQRVFWFGVEGYFLSGPVAAVFNLPQAGGILVQQTVSSSPAGHLGIRPGHLKAGIEGQALRVGGDVLLAFDGIALDSEEGLVAGRQRMAALRPGDPYSVEVLRAGQRLTLQGVVP